jgi:hypothetical protein
MTCGESRLNLNSPLRKEGAFLISFSEDTKKVDFELV